MENKKLSAFDEAQEILGEAKKEEQSLTEIMKDISREGKAHGMTPEVLEDLLDKPIKHIL